MSKVITGNVVGIPNPVSDWEQTNPNMADYIKNKPQYLVNSVNGESGDVTITPENIGAEKSGASANALDEAKLYTDDAISKIEIPDVGVSIDDTITSKSKTWSSDKIDTKITETLSDVAKSITCEQIGAAPTGFGLGEFAATGVTDCDELTKNGWYSTTDDALNRPIFTDEDGECVVFVISNGAIIQQIGFSCVHGAMYLLTRFYDGDAWSGWQAIMTDYNVYEYCVSAGDFDNRNAQVDEAIANAQGLADYASVIAEEAEKNANWLLENAATKQEVEQLVSDGKALLVTVANNVADYSSQDILNAILAGKAVYLKMWSGTYIALSWTTADEAIFSAPFLTTTTGLDGNTYGTLSLRIFTVNKTKACRTNTSAQPEQEYINAHFTAAKNYVDTQVSTIETDLKDYIEETILGGAW